MGDSSTLKRGHYCGHLASFLKDHRLEPRVFLTGWLKHELLEPPGHMVETNSQLSRAIAEIKKISKLYGYIPKFLHCLRVNLSLRSKLFNYVPLKKFNF